MSDDRIIHTPAAVGIVAGVVVVGSLVGLHLHYDNERQSERLRAEWQVEAEVEAEVRIHDHHVLWLYTGPDARGEKCHHGIRYSVTDGADGVLLVVDEGIDDDNGCYQGPERDR